MRRLIPLAFLALLLFAGTQEAQAQANVTGSWEISWETPRGDATSTFNFQQDGATLAGSAMMMMGRPGGGGGGEQEVEISDGKVEGDQVTFSIVRGRSDRAMTLTFTGTVEGDTMEGVFSSQRGETPFTGKRIK